jgi:hypothetical protein
VPVRILGTDLTSTAVEPMEPDALKEGDQVVTRVNDPSSASSAGGSNSSQNPATCGGPPGRRFRGGGFGGGPR